MHAGPPVKRLAVLAVGMFGVALCFGAAEIACPPRIHGSAEAYKDKAQRLAARRSVERREGGY